MRLQLKKKIHLLFILIGLVACAKHGGSGQNPPAAPLAQPSADPSQSAPSAPSVPLNPEAALEAVGCKFSDNTSNAAALVLTCPPQTQLASLDGLVQKIGQYLGVPASQPEQKQKIAAAQAYLAKLNAARAQRSQKGAGIAATITTELNELTKQGCGFSSGRFTCPAEPSPLKLLKRSSVLSRLIKAMTEAPSDIEMSAADATDNAAKVKTLQAAAVAMQATYQAELNSTTAEIATIEKRVDVLAEALGSSLGIKILVPEDCFADTVNDPIAQCAKVEAFLKAVRALLANPAAQRSLAGRHIDLLTLHLKASGPLTVNHHYSPDRVTENLEFWASSADQFGTGIRAVPQRGQGLDSGWQLKANDYTATLNAINVSLKPLPVAVDASIDTFTEQTPALKNFLLALQQMGQIKKLHLSKLWLGVNAADSGDGAFFDAPSGAMQDGELNFTARTSIVTLISELKKL